jgi:VanZ family protein
LLATYWLLLMIGTHIPASVVGSPLIWDKLVHWAAYAGLAGLLVLVVQSRYGLNLRRYTVVFLIVGGYGAIDELAQLPIPGRNADFQDWVANLLGAASGLIIFRVVSTLVSFRRPGSIRPWARPNAPRDRSV